MTATRTVHTTQVGSWPDGKQFVMCTCPIGVNHPPADLMNPADEEGMWWIRFSR